MSNFVLYLIGTALVACGLALAAYKLNAPPIWIIICLIIIISLGIMAGVLKTRQKEKSDTDNYKNYKCYEFGFSNKY